jgi:hypothetical protein
VVVVVAAVRIAARAVMIVTAAPGAMIVAPVAPRPGFIIRTA